ncbi:MAG: DUF4838 domain-containing protein [Chloroflexota bacterium]
MTNEQEAPMTERIQLDLDRAWQILTVRELGLAGKTAVSDLQQTLQKITGQPCPITTQPNDQPTIQIENVGGGEGDSDESFQWQASPNHIVLCGNSGCGVAHAIYHFLHLLGCNWLAPGDLWSILPTDSTVEIAAAGSEAPAFAGRCLIIGHHAFMKDINDWIIWAARNRYNNIFLHTAPDDVGGGSVPEWFWAVKQESALRLLREREMVIEYGGHGLPSLLPRKLFKQMPEAFREENGRRTKQYNFCPTNERGLAIVRENARVYFAQRPGYDVYHVWADDIPGGGWCSCATCVGYSVSDQLLLATNAVAQVLAEVEPQATISFIAYLDTEAPPTQVEPLPNVSLLWAPRTRNYGRSLADPTCPIAPYYNETLAKQVDTFGTPGTDATAVFEYYSDAILFKSVLPVMPTILQQDLVVYRSLGVQTMQTLMTGTRPWVTAQLTNWLFGQLAWQPEQDVAALVVRFCRAAFGEGAEEMVAYYGTLERVFTAVLQQTPDQRERGFEFSRSPWKLVKNPVADMEDPIHASAQILQARAAELPQLLAAIDQAATHLAAAQAHANNPRLAAEAKAFGLLQPWLQFNCHRLALYDALKTNDPQAVHLWQTTKTAYDAVQAWGANNIIDPLYRQNFKTMQFAFWGLRLRRILADQFSSIRRFAIDLGTLLQLAGSFAQMVRDYKRSKRAA